MPAKQEFDWRSASLSFALLIGLAALLPACGGDDDDAAGDDDAAATDDDSAGDDTPADDDAAGDDDTADDDAAAGDDDDALQPTLSSIQEHIFTPSCTASVCHAGGRPPHGLNLEAGNSYGALVSVTSAFVGEVYVVPGDPEGSLLYKIIEGPLPDLGLKNQMPKSSLPLKPEQIEAIRQWIADGAQDN